MNEAETRAEHIDPALAAAGWGVVEGSRIHREYLIAPGRLEGYGLRAKPEIADYILIYRNRKLGVMPRIENGNLQDNQPPTMSRLDLWLRARVQVPTRPDWFFVNLGFSGLTG